MSKQTQALILFPGSTHPVIAGSQVRVNFLIRHLCQDLGWDVDMWVPQGTLRPESWGQNMQLLRAIYIPRENPGSRSLPKLPHIRRALSGGLIEGIYRELRDFLSRFKQRSHRQKAFELLTYRNKMHPSRQKQSEAVSTDSLVSSRLVRYAASYLRDSVCELVEKNDYDVVIVTYVWLSKIVEPLFTRKSRPRLVCDTIDVQYIREARLQEFRDSAAVDFEKERELELDLLRQYDTIIAITDIDREELQRALPDKDVCTVMIQAPVADVSTANGAGSRHDSAEIYDLIFVGGNNEANRYSVLHLLSAIIPELLKRKPDLRVAIAGRVSTDDEVRAKATSPAVDLLGYIDSLEDFYRSAKVLAAPIPAGGGVKVKVLEAMAYGLPVITTPVGAEGIPLLDGKHGYIAQDDEEFVSKTIELLSKPDLRRQFSRNAQRTILENLGPASVYKEFDLRFQESSLRG